MKKEKLTEQRLCEIIIENFPHADIYPEVPCSTGTIDIVIIDRPLTIVIEAKMSLSMQVMNQDVLRLGMGNNVYVATPVEPNELQRQYMKHFGIGIMRVRDGGYTHPIVVELEPRLFRKIKPPQLEEWMKQSVAGSQSKRITAFGNFVNELTKDLENCPEGKTYKELFDSKRYRYYNVFSSFKNNVYQYIRRGVIPDLHTVNGKVRHDKYLDQPASEKEKNDEKQQMDIWE